MSRLSGRRSALVGLVLAAAVCVDALAGCGSNTAAAPIPQPATVESIPGSASVRVRLTADAARRIGLQTATIKSQVVPGRPQLAAAAAAPIVTTPTTGPAAPTVTAATVVATPVRAPGDTEPPRKAASTTTSPTAAPPTAPPAATTTTVPTPRLTVATAAVLYQPSGQAFVYVVTATLTYQRQPIVVDYVVADLAVLVSGPPPGTTVVTVGADEVLGAELGVGGQELGG